ncbi:MAG: 50S ribosomal protein L15e [Candidatus Aenigmatarchaeota archaeon]
MGMYKEIKDKWKEPDEEVKKRLKKWRDEDAVKRIERPTRLDKARELGYKSKQGVTVARSRVKKGTRKRQEVSGGRRTANSGSKEPRKKSKQQVAEERTTKKFPNLRVLDSYWVGEDGKHKWFEVILVDPEHPAMKKDKDLKWITKEKEKDRSLR